MSYIVKASWWMEDLKWDIAKLSDATRDAEVLVDCANICAMRGTITITHNGEVIQEFKVGGAE